jgi:hypothetical protein
MFQLVAVGVLVAKARSANLALPVRDAQRLLPDPQKLEPP